MLQITGITIGFLGVALIARPLSGDISKTNAEGVLFMVLGSLSIGASFVYAKKYLLPVNIPAAALTTY